MSVKINRFLILWIIVAFLMGSMPQWAKQKTQTKKKPVAAQTVKGSSKKKTASSKKKKTAKKRRSSSKKKSVKSRSRSKTAKSLTPVKTVKAQNDTIINPDDLPALEEDDSDEFPVEVSTLDVSELFEKYIAPNQYSSVSDSVNYKEKVIMEIIRLMKTPYKFGGNTSKGIDCSAFTKTIFNNSFSLELPRTAREQFQIGLEIEKTDLKFGDLVFFNTRRRVRPGHVGIYIGNNQFAHSSSKQGVIVSSLELDFYSKRFMGARRVENHLSGR